MMQLSQQELEELLKKLMRDMAQPSSEQKEVIQDAKDGQSILLDIEQEAPIPLY